jgi:hypothetical protein
MHTVKVAAAKYVLAGRAMDSGQGELELAVGDRTMSDAAQSAQDCVKAYLHHRANEITRRKRVFKVEERVQKVVVSEEELPQSLLCRASTEALVTTSDSGVGK